MRQAEPNAKIPGVMKRGIEKRKKAFTASSQQGLTDTFTNPKERKPEGATIKGGKSRSGIKNDAGR